MRSPTTAAGKYWYRLTVVDASVAGITSCRIASNLLAINVHPIPVANAGPDRVYIKGYPVTLLAEASGENISFDWDPVLYMDDAALIQPTVIPAKDITYVLSVLSAFNCSNKDTVNVGVVDGIYVPTAFTPNADGKNDSVAHTFFGCWPGRRCKDIQSLGAARLSCFVCNSFLGWKTKWAATGHRNVCLSYHL